MGGASLGITIEPLARASCHRGRGAAFPGACHIPAACPRTSAGCPCAQADIAGRESLVLASKEEFAKRVAKDLFRFMACPPTQTCNPPSPRAAACRAGAPACPQPSRRPAPSAPPPCAGVVPHLAARRSTACAHECARPLVRRPPCGPDARRAALQPCPWLELRLGGTSRCACPLRGRFGKFQSAFRRDPDFLMRRGQD